jgi:cytochrome c
MRLKLATIALVGLVACAAKSGVVDPPVIAAAQTEKTQWDGVFTAEQAKRGEPLYAEKCASCHGAELGGGEMAPGLAGGEFTANWNDLSLGDMFERMRISMPQNNPGSLSRQENADILAFMLQKGGYPEGKEELPTATEALNQIKFAATKPAQ